MKNKMLAVAILSSLAALSTSVSAETAQAVVKWTGFVPGVISGESITITGEGGVENIDSGLLTIAADGSYSSERNIVLESRAVTEGVVGDLVSANWTLKNAVTDFNGQISDVAPTVLNAGTEVQINGVVSNLQTLDLSVSGQAGSNIDTASLGGSQVNVNLVLTAEQVI